MRLKNEQGNLTPREKKDDAKVVSEIETLLKRRLGEGRL